MLNFYNFLSIRNYYDSYLFYSCFLVIKYILVTSNILGMSVPSEMTFGEAITAQDIARQGYHFRRNSQGIGHVWRWIMRSKLFKTSLPLMCIDDSLFVCMVSLLVSYLDDNRYFLAIIYNATAAVVWSGHDSKSGPANQLMKTNTSCAIWAYFVAVPSPCSTKIKRPRDAQIRSLVAPCLMKHKTRGHPRPTPQLPMATRDEEEADKDAAVRRSCSSRGGRRSYYH